MQASEFQMWLARHNCLLSRIFEGAIPPRRNRLKSKVFLHHVQASFSLAASAIVLELAAPCTVSQGSRG